MKRRPAMPVWVSLLVVLCALMGFALTKGTRDGGAIPDEYLRIARETTCGDNCKNCSGSGTCSECYPGFFGDRCDGKCDCLCSHDGATCLSCPEGYHGNRCELTCPVNCEYGFCDLRTGHCSGCKKGWYGNDCSKPCDRNCKTSGNSVDVCTFTDGTCTECTDGRCGSHCNLTCAQGCRSCDRSTCGCTGSDCQEGRGGDLYCRDEDKTCCAYECQRKSCKTCQIRRFPNNPKSIETCSSCNAGFFGDGCQLGNFQPDINHCNYQHDFLAIEKLVTGKCGCDDGNYGYHCNQSCPTSCKRCTGPLSCSECSAGYYGPFCERACPNECQSCSKGGEVCLSCRDTTMYGKQCECRTTECTAKSGSDCLRCKQPGWQPIGSGCCPCSSTCKDGCIEHFTNSKTLICRGGCADGFFGTDCSQKCNEKCRKLNYKTDVCTPEGECIHGCEDGWLGPSCNYTCAGNFANCANCTEDTIEGVVCSTCQSGFYPANGICSPCTHCHEKDCDSSNGRCLKACADGYYSEVDDPYGRFCGKKCSFTCRDRKCSANGGKCELCREGFYGNMCEQICSIFCNNVTCDRETGSCVSCQSGFTGPRCEDQCSPNCVNGCFQNGTCTECRAKNAGSTCDISCSGCLSSSCDRYTPCASCRPGFYGKWCTQRCSDGCFICSKSSENCVQCKEGYKLRKTTGSVTICEKCAAGERCLNPLAENYNSNQTHSDCPKGKFGSNCDKNCPSKCAMRSGIDGSVFVGSEGTVGNGPCDLFTGACLKNCVLGTFGPFCNQTCGNCVRKYNNVSVCNLYGSCEECDSGFYGSNCDVRCPHACDSQGCDQTTGECKGSCLPGYVGDSCQYSNSSPVIVSTSLLFINIVLNFFFKGG